MSFTDFPARAEGLAREIAAAEPDLIGLQEAELWRSQTPANFVPGNASHVEYDFVDSELVREAQAIEVIAGPANTSLPVVLVADANSNANGDATTPAYSSLVGAGFADAWFEAHPGQIVSTCCNEELLTNPTFPNPADDEGRIDLVLFRGVGDFHVLGADLFRTNPATDRVFNGLALIWPSDHAGVAATLQILK